MVICPLLGKVLPKCSVSSSYPDPISTSAFLKDQDGLQLDRPLCLQDPFELSHNVCRNLPEKAVRRFVVFCTEAARIAQSCLSAEQRPSGGLCSLLKIEVGWKYFSVIPCLHHCLLRYHRWRRSTTSTAGWGSSARRKRRCSVTASR